MEYNANNTHDILGATSSAGTEDAKETQQGSPFLYPFRRASRLLHSPPLEQNETSHSSPQELQRSKAPEKEVNDFTKLGDRISELLEMMGG